MWYWIPTPTLFSFVLIPVCRKHCQWWVKTSPCSSVPTERHTSPKRRWQRPPPASTSRQRRWAHEFPHRTGCPSHPRESPSKWSATPAKSMDLGKSPWTVTQNTGANPNTDNPNAVIVMKCTTQLQCQCKTFAAAVSLVWIQRVIFD